MIFFNSTDGRIEVKMIDFTHKICYFEYMDIKDNLAQNLVRYRKTVNLTQIEFAEKFNYTDKAVSKWERGESIPDLIVLKQIADFYNVTIDDLIKEPTDNKPIFIKNLLKRRVILELALAVVVCIIAVLVYSLLLIITPDLGGKAWLAFIYGLIIMSILFVIFSAVWKQRTFTIISSSALTWSTLLAVFLTLLTLLPSPPSALWMIFLIGVPVQAFLILLFSYGRLKK